MGAQDRKKLLKAHPKGQGILDGTLDDETLRAIENARDDDAFVLVGDVETEYCCPACGFEWSGRPKPNKVED